MPTLSGNQLNQVVVAMLGLARAMQTAVLSRNNPATPRPGGLVHAGPQGDTSWLLCRIPGVMMNGMVFVMLEAPLKLSQVCIYAVCHIVAAIARHPLLFYCSRVPGASWDSAPNYGVA